MSDNVKIYFEGQDLFSGICETPYITQSYVPVRDNQQIGLMEEFRLEGTIVADDCSLTCSYTIPDTYLGAGNCGTCALEEIGYKKYLLLSSLTGQVGSFQIKEGNTSVYSGALATIQSLNFEDSNYAGLLPFSLDLKIYDENCWKQTYGVETVVDEARYVENDCDYDVQRTISAKGFRTSATEDNSFTNAKNWVQARTGETICAPVFLPTASNLILRSQSDVANRFAGTYELTQDYIYSTGASDTGNILKTSFNYDSGIDFSTVSVDGTIEGGLLTNMSDLRTRFHGLDLYSLCNTHYQRSETGSLNTGAVEFSVQENDELQSLEFNATYNNNESADPYMIDNFNYTEDYTNGRRCVTFDADILSSVCCRDFRNTKILNYYSGFDFDTHIRNKWVEYGLSGQLEPEPNTQGFNYDEYNSRINVSYTYCEVEKTLPNCIANLDYSINFKPPLVQYSVDPSCVDSGVYIIQDLGYNRRGVFNIRGNARIDDCCDNSGAVNSLVNFINVQQSTYISGYSKIITEQNIDWNESNKNVNFSYSWSYDGPDLYSDNFKSGFVDTLQQNLVDIESGIQLISIGGQTLIKIGVN